MGSEQSHGCCSPLLWGGRTVNRCIVTQTISHSGVVRAPETVRAAAVSTGVQLTRRLYARTGSAQARPICNIRAGHRTVTPAPGPVRVAADGWADRIATSGRRRRPAAGCSGSWPVTSEVKVVSHKRLSTTTASADGTAQARSAHWRHVADGNCCSTQLVSDRAHRTSGAGHHVVPSAGNRCEMIVFEKASRSSGLRLVISGPSWTTSLSIQLAPALVRSVCRLG